MDGGWSKKNISSSSLLATHLLVGCLPLSPPLLPPPSLDASLRSAAARATGGGGTLVEPGLAGGWDPGLLGLRHCSQVPQLTRGPGAPRPPPLGLHHITANSLLSLGEIHLSNPPPCKCFQ